MTDLVTTAENRGIFRGSVPNHVKAAAVEVVDMVDAVDVVEAVEPVGKGACKSCIAASQIEC